VSALLDKQLLFTQKVATLIAAIFAAGYACKFGHAKRCMECPVGHKRSLHKQSLAVDLLLFKGQGYLQDTADYEAFGRLWESWGGTWGGRWGDGNHFSFEHDGMK